MISYKHEKNFYPFLGESIIRDIPISKYGKYKKCEKDSDCDTGYTCGGQCGVACCKGNTIYGDHVTVYWDEGIVHGHGCTGIYLSIAEVM